MPPDFGLREPSLRFNASCHREPSDALQEAVADDLLQHMDDDIVPVVRCLAILGCL